MPYTYPYPRPALTVDCVIFGLDSTKQLKVLLIERGMDPFSGSWAFPGGFVEMEEDLKTAALRELAEETGLRDIFIEQLYTFGAPGRDPRGRVVSVAYWGLIPLTAYPIRSASDAKQVQWFSIEQLPELAFDHQQIFDLALRRLRNKIRYQPILFELFTNPFTLSQLQGIYETILGIPQLNKRNFRTRILKMEVLEEVGSQQGVAHRPAKLYRFNQEKYKAQVREKQDDLIRRGLDFDI